MKETFYFITSGFLWYFSAVNFVYLLTFCFGFFKVFRREKEVSIEDFTAIIRSESLPTVAFIIPAYNESSNIINALKNFVRLTYPYKEIIVVNDESTDNTLDLMKEFLDLAPIPLYFEQTLATKPIKAVYQSRRYKDVIVIDKEHGKKFDSLNVGINACRSDFFLSIDADSGIDNASFESLIRPIFSYPNLIGLGAAVRVINSCTLEFNRIETVQFPQKYFPAMQAVEYLRAFMQRQGWDYFGGNIVLSGCFAFFKKEAIIAIGGYADTVAEDMEIIIRLHRSYKEGRIPYSIRYLPDPVAWTETPETLKPLARQRKNWHRGMLDCLWFHKKIFLNPKYGIFGIFTLPYFAWGEAIEPLVELLAYILVPLGLILGWVNVPVLILFFAIVWGYMTIFTIVCLVVEEVTFKKYPRFRSFLFLFVYTFLENIGYRQLTVIWRINGWISFLKAFKDVRKVNKKIKNMMKAFHESRAKN